MKVWWLFHLWTSCHRRGGSNTYPHQYYRKERHSLLSCITVHITSQLKKKLSCEEQTTFPTLKAATTSTAQDTQYTDNKQQTLIIVSKAATVHNKKNFKLSLQLVGQVAGGKPPQLQMHHHIHGWNWRQPRRRPSGWPRFRAHDAQHVAEGGGFIPSTEQKAKGREGEQECRLQSDVSQKFTVEGLEAADMLQQGKFLSDEEIKNLHNGSGQALSL